VAQSLDVTCQASPNLSVHLTGVPLRFTPAGDFIDMLRKNHRKNHHELAN